MARVCDICKKLAPEARQFDLALPNILKLCQLQSHSINSILERLKIKSSIVGSKPTYGDICKACEVDIEKEVAKIIEDGVNGIADKITDIGNRTLNILKTHESVNAEFFEQMTSDWRRVRGK